MVFKNYLSYGYDNNFFLKAFWKNVIQIPKLKEQMFGVTKTPSEEKILLYVHEHPEFKKTFL